MDTRFVNSQSDGFVLNLEFKDNNDYPIILCAGIPYGSEEDINNQFMFVLSEMKSIKPKKFCTVIETNHKSFRFPDKFMRTLFHQYEKDHKDLIGPIHFINLSFCYRIGIKIALHFLPERITSNIIVHKTNSSFLNMLPESSKLKRWKGHVDFDVDEYVKSKNISFQPITYIEDAQLKLAHDSLLSKIRKKSCSH
tara:strand:- start:315 stop:899 length:585 start_codon:yes stop_codon:yes gene_type:complete